MEVIASSSKDKAYSAVTDNIGYYKLKMVIAEDYTVLVQPPENYIFRPYTKSVRVEKGKNIVEANFDLPPAGAIAGIIYKEDGVTPLADASIFALTSKGVSMTSTDSSGRYILTGLVPEVSANVKIFTYGYGAVEKGGMNIIAGQITPNINIVLSNSGTGVRGIVGTNDSVSLPIKDAFVALKSDSGFGITITDPTGNYVVSGIPEGVYEATVFKIGFERKVVGNIIVSKGEIAKQNFMLKEQPIWQLTSLNDIEPMNVITLNFQIDNPEFPYAALQLIDSGGCVCGAFSFSSVVGWGVSIGKAICTCKQTCGGKEIITTINVNTLCACLGFSIGVGGGVQYCSEAPTTGISEGWQYDIGVVTIGGGCAGAGKVGIGVSHCSCITDVVR